MAKVSISKTALEIVVVLPETYKELTAMVGENPTYDVLKSKLINRFLPLASEELKLVQHLIQCLITNEVNSIIISCPYLEIYE